MTDFKKSVENYIQRKYGTIEPYTDSDEMLYMVGGCVIGFQKKKGKIKSTISMYTNYSFSGEGYGKSVGLAHQTAISNFKKEVYEYVTCIKSDILNDSGLFE